VPSIANVVDVIGQIPAVAGSASCNYTEPGRDAETIGLFA
jgi:hypothetical protein